MSRELMQQALEALEARAVNGYFERFDETITALRAALAEPVPLTDEELGPLSPRYTPEEAIAELHKRTEEFVCSTGLCKFRKPLTEMEIVNLMPAQIPADYDKHLIDFAREIERAIKQEEA